MTQVNGHKNEKDLMQLIDESDSESKCRERLVELRWPDGVACLRCGSVKVWRIETRGLFQCSSCDYQFSALVGTIFQDTHLPLRKWFVATYLMIESRKGISASQLMRTLGVSYKTAWHLCHRVRAAMRDAYPMPLTGIVEIDETYVGGKVRGKGRGYKGNKATVVGAVQRGGNIVLEVVHGRDRETLYTFVEEVTADETEAYFTDDWAPYQGIGDENTRHETVNHSIEEWVRGDVHTNSVEGVWSLLKRSIIGAYHRVSVKQLQAYLDEIEWRFNNRDNPWLFRDTLMRLLQAETLPYRQLVA